jgi:ATP-dependent Clp protease, protease subunit
MTFFAKANGKRGEIYIYESIGEGWFEGITAKSFADSMRELGNVAALDIYINSPGGSVFDGIAIYNQIKRHAAAEKIVHIDGIAASIASIVAMAGTEIRIAANGMIMIHDPWGMSIGTAAEMRQQADALDKVRATLLDTYALRTGGDKAQISDWMTAETWMSAADAVEHGFATKQTEEKAIKAEFAMLAKFTNVPEPLRRQAASLDARFARMDMRLNRLQDRTQKNRGASPAKA